MEKDRLAAFMDAVLAIIMTILVLELPKPEEVSFSAIWALRGSYFSYILSFFWLGTMWIYLHNEWSEVRSISKSVVWWGIILLFCSSWIPYAISVVGLDSDNPVGQFLYGVSVLLVTFANIGLSRALLKCHAEEEGSCLHINYLLNKKKIAPDILLKIIGIILSATVWPRAVLWSVLATMIWMHIPLGVFSKKTENKNCGS